MNGPRNDLPAMPRWRAWIARLKASLRRLFGRAGAGGAPPGDRGGSAAPPAVQPLARERAGLPEPPPARGAGEPSPIATGPEATRKGDSIVPATPQSGVPQGQPPELPAQLPGAKVRTRRGRWQSDTMHTGSGRIDLAPWVPPERTYRVFVPGTLSPDPCIVLMLHGCKQTPEDIAEGTRLNEHAEDLGWIVVYPEQSRAANKWSCWNWFDPANERGDGECALVMAIHTAVRARLKLNEPRSFLAGMSAGGALASLLALRYARHWAGVAIHSGLPYAAALEPWGAQRAMREGASNLDAAARLKRRATDISPLPALIMHGNEDTVVNRRNADLLVRQFLGWDGYFPEGVDWATAPLPPALLTESSTTYGHSYILRDFGEGLHPPVRECEVVGMGHAWSGGDSALPYHDEMGPDASALMMEFFATIAERT